PSSSSRGQDQVYRLERIPDEELGRCSLAYDPCPSRLDGLYRLECICCLYLRDSEAHSGGKMRVAPCDCRKVAPLCSDQRPGIACAAEVLGVVDLPGIARRYAPDGMAEGVIWMGDYSDPSLLAGQVCGLLRAEPSGRQILNAQDQQMAF